MDEVTNNDSTMMFIMSGKLREGAATLHGWEEKKIGG